METKATKGTITSDSKIYRLEELVDQIAESITNIDKLIDETQKLNAVLNKHAKRMFKDFIKQQEDQIKMLEDKKKELTNKKENISLIIKTAREDKDKEGYLSLILNTLIQF